MYVIEIVKLPDKKKPAIAVYDTKKPNEHLVIGYINHYEEEFKQALVDSKYINYMLGEKNE